MTTVKTISLPDLAKDLCVDADRLPPLILEGYLRLAKSGLSLEDTFVERPPAGARDWLRAMFAPVAMRPMLPVRDAAKMLDMTLDDLRKWCIHFNIPISMDAVFGELLSLKGFYQIEHGFYEIRNPLRTDRQALLVRLMRVNKMNATREAYLRRYDRRLEEEITRIAKLPEPQRTIQATAFWSAYQDAKIVGDSLGRKKGSKHEKILDRKVYLAEQSMLGKNDWNLQLNMLVKRKPDRLTGKKKVAAREAAILAAAAAGAQAADDPSASESLASDR